MKKVYETPACRAEKMQIASILMLSEQNLGGGGTMGGGHDAAPERRMKI